MQLFSPRLRVLLMCLVWLVALSAFLIWLGGARLTRITLAGGPANSETLLLSQAIARALNAEQLGFVPVATTGI